MLKVGVIYGGHSPEHTVSIRSAETIIQYLDPKRFEVMPVYITSDRQWTIPGIHFTCTESIPPRLDCDVIFSVLHGSAGEDGHMQSLFELWELPYVGSGVLGSALGMNKVIAKQLIASQNITHLIPYVYFSRKTWHLKPAEQLAQIETLGYPVFIKPVSAGSSVGIQRVHEKDAAREAIRHALVYDDYVIIEKALTIREIEVGILESLNADEPPLISVAGEIIMQRNFYSYEAKYLDFSGTTMEIPASLSVEQLKSVQSMAGDIFELLRLEGLARIDFFLDDTNGCFYFNEVNTLPGFTADSMYPKLWEVSGQSITQLLTHLIELAFQRHKNRGERI